jgi:hypothetical protein
MLALREALPVAVERSQISRIFQVWHKAKYREWTLALSPAALVLAHDALRELRSLAVPTFDDWWLRNHWRYGALREQDRRRVREMTREFLDELSHRRVVFGDPPLPEPASQDDLTPRAVVIPFARS